MDDEITVEEQLQRLEDIKGEASRKRAEEARRAKREVAEGMITMPELNGALFIKNNSNSAGADVATLLEVLKEESDKVIAGDDSSVQRYLFTQLHMTDMLFHRFAGLMMSPGNREITQFKMLGDMAAKFQNMSRRTAATLIDIKRPRQKTYIRRVDQLNAAQNQQVNNFTEQELNSDNEISGGTDVEALDERGAQAAIGKDSHLGTLEEEYGAKDGGRQSEVVYERTEDG